MEEGMDGRMEEGKCLNHRLHRLHGEEKLLSARFSFNAGTSNQGIKESRNQGINGMNALWHSPKSTPNARMAFGGYE